MAYNEKYYLTFCNPKGQNCRVSIMQDDFEGEATELTGQPDPIVISYDNNDDFKFKPIIESEAEINLIFDDETLSFSELWTSNERTFKVEYRIEGFLEWTGFIIPEGFDYTLKGGKYPATLLAKDGLATLEGILFKTDSNNFYGTQDLGYNEGEMFPFILVLTEILRKLDLGIDLWTLVDYFEQTMTTLNENSRNSDPLSLAYVNVKTYVNDTDRKDVAYWEDVNEAWDCKKIIENICNIFGSRLYQENGVWKLKSVHADSYLASNFSNENDPFSGTNPTTSGFFFNYECWFSETKEFKFTETRNIFSLFDKVAVGDTFYINTSGDIVTEKGNYLVKGKNTVIEITEEGIVLSVRNYKNNVENYYWKKYNNTAGYIGRELAQNLTVIPCSDKDVFLKDNDATVRMDIPYKQFRVNYNYTFIREGDSPINLIKNGNFSQPFGQYGELEAPPEWERYVVFKRFGLLRPGFNYIRCRVEDVISSELEATGGNSRCLRLGLNYGNTQPDKTTGISEWGNGLAQSFKIFREVQFYNFIFFAKYKYRVNNVFYMPVFRAVFRSNDPADAGYYYLENSKKNDSGVGFSWRKGTTNLYTYDNINFCFYAEDSENYRSSEDGNDIWRKFIAKIPTPNSDGTLQFFIIGLSSNKETVSLPRGNHFNIKKEVNSKFEDAQAYYVTKNFTDQGGQISRLKITGLNFGYVPDPDAEVPKTDYIYANGDIDYTFQEDPIEVFNGDTTSDEIVSGIYVPTNVSDGKNKWDTFDNAFGKTDIGMILCKSIMQQYYSPNRLLDCEIKADNFRYGGIIEFEHIPGIKYIMLRGSFNAKRGYWEGCTLAQISSEEVASGGVISGDDLTPKWVPTGNYRCVKDSSGLNTGYSELEKQDQNTNSDSFGDYRWEMSEEISDSCPIGQPSKYYWGTDIEGFELSNLTDYTIEFEDEDLKTVKLIYSNTGGKYIYFLHLASLGSVVRVSNDYQQQIISSFTYLADITINGYLYRVLRQNFVTSEFSNFSLTYFFQ